MDFYLEFGSATVPPHHESLCHTHKASLDSGEQVCEELCGHCLAQVGPSNLAKRRGLLLPVSTDKSSDLKAEREHRATDSLAKMKEFSLPKYPL